MLDSLVRVSRRVGGATDLLGREMRTATEHCSLYESSHVPVRCEARTPRAASRTDNFTRGLRCAPNSSCRKLRGKCTRETRRPSSTVIADRILQSHATPRLSSPKEPTPILFENNLQKLLKSSSRAIEGVFWVFLGLFGEIRLSNAFQGHLKKGP